MNKNIPLWFKVTYILSIILAFHFFLPAGIENKVMIEDKTSEVKKLVYNAVPHDTVLETFAGEVTGYGPDCAGCSGRTSSGYNVKNGNIYYNDDTYGKLRIVAASKKYSLGTIVRITIPNYSKDPIVAIVLDRGGAITKNKLDLLFESENSTGNLGKRKNVKCEILRYGW